METAQKPLTAEGYLAKVDSARQVADELNMPTAKVPFYNQRDDIERAALARTVRDGTSQEKLPGFWNWLWH